MATPTEAEIKTQISNSVDLFEELLKYTTDAATNYIDLEDTLVQALESDFAPEEMAAIGSFRSRLDGALREIGNVFSSQFRKYGKFIKSPETGVISIFSRLFQHFLDNTLSVNSREFTFGGPSAGGGNIGDGVIKRLNIDRGGFDIENQTPDEKIATVIRDQNSNSRLHEELLQFRGETRGKDALQVTGSGRITNIRAKSANNSLLLNSSFTGFDGVVGASGLTDLTNWVVNSGGFTNIEATTTTADIYRNIEGEAIPAALKFTGNEKITQKLTIKGTELNPARPYYLQIAINRSNGVGGDGTVTIRMGTNSANVVLAAQSGYFVLSLALDTNLWFENFNEDDIDIEIELSGNTVGDVLIDDVLFLQFEPFDGSWYLPIGGATAWLRDDVFTWTDTALDVAILQRWFWRAFGVYLPSKKDGSETWSDP